MPGQWHSRSNFTGSRVYVCLGVTGHLYFWQNDWGLLCATAATEGGMDMEKSWHIKLTLEKNILPLLLLGFELATFQSQVQHSYQQAILATHSDRIRITH